MENHKVFGERIREELNSHLLYETKRHFLWQRTWRYEGSLKIGGGAVTGSLITPR
jgi:hypothetical protein